MVSSPPDGGETQPIIRIVDDLPAPFGPRKPNASPRYRSKSIPSTAVNPPNFLVRPRARTSTSLSELSPTSRGYPGGLTFSERFYPPPHTTPRDTVVSVYPDRTSKDSATVN